MQICNLRGITATLLIFRLLIYWLLLCLLLIFLGNPDRSDQDNWSYLALVFRISIWSKPRIFALVKFALINLPENLEERYQ
jgi:hypothetical protein